jgi:uncharacterized protein YjbJ (UPF0337 family)
MMHAVHALISCADLRLFVQRSARNPIEALAEPAGVSTQLQDFAPMKGSKMNKDTVKGAIDQTVGSTKRHVGGALGDTKTEVEGAVQQIKGKIETGVGKLKDVVHDAKHDAAAEHEAHEEANREKRHAELVKDHNLL